MIAEISEVWTFYYKHNREQPSVSKYMNLCYTVHELITKTKCALTPKVESTTHILYPTNSVLLLLYHSVIIDIRCLEMYNRDLEKAC